MHVDQHDTHTLPDAFKLDETEKVDDNMHFSATTPDDAKDRCVPDCPLYEELCALAHEVDAPKIKTRIRTAAALALLERARGVVVVRAMKDVLDTESPTGGNAARVIERQNVQRSPPRIRTRRPWLSVHRRPWPLRASKTRCARSRCARCRCRANA